MDILVRPHSTEKITNQNEKGIYGFIVAKKANKIQIKKAVEDLYGVNVADVRTMVYGGKTKSRNTKNGLVVGKKSGYKKAIIQLAEGDFIDIYGNEAAAE